MEIPDCNCGSRPGENNHKLGNSYMSTADSGYDSIYNGCTSILMEKSFCRESFDIFSPDSANRTPIKQSSSALKYHVSTPKNSATIKRHLYSSFNTSSLKRSKSENNENDPISTQVNTSIHNKYNHLNDNSCPLKTLHNYDFAPHKNILNSTTNHQLSFAHDSALWISKQSSIYDEELKEQSFVPERPSKCLRNFTPSIKHSKRKLYTPIVEDKTKTNRICFNGTRFLNMIGKLAPFPVILDDIFKRLSSEDLLNMSLVSRNWNSIVKSNRNANARIQKYLNESRNFKENLKESNKPAIVQEKRHPFSQFNIVSTSNKNQVPVLSSSFSDNQNVVQQLCVNERLVKCPRCSRGSIITDSSARLHSISLISVPSTTSSDLTFLNEKADSICGINPIENNTNKSQLATSEDFGICTSVACKYMFCPKCLCQYHPGEKCKISEPESPSKLLVCHKKLKTINKPNSKISTKRQSLRRLCFS